MALREAERTEIDGIPVFWADAPEPFAAALVFRVGLADETFATGGVTHLVEHLALWALGDPDYTYSAFVAPTLTTFFAEGTEDQVTSFLLAVTSALGSLPLERLEAERRVLKTEVAGFHPGPAQASLALRFGPAGYGLAGYEQFGLNRLEGAYVASWARERFSAGNAAVWMTGRPPRGFRLNLGAGTRIPPPAPQPIADVRLPAYYAQGSGGIAGSFTAPRSSAAGMARRIAEERARKLLRYERGLAYEVGCVYEPLSADLAHVTYFADCLDPAATATRDGMLEVLDGLAGRGPTPEELEKDIEAMRKYVTNAWETASWLDYCVHEELYGAPLPSKEETLRRMEDVTPAAAAEAVARALEGLLLLVPESVEMQEGRFKQYPRWSDRAVRGRTYRPKGILRRLSGEYAVVGAEGISLVVGDGNAITVRFDECVGVLRSPERKHLLFAVDGTTLWFDPADFRGGQALIDAVEASLPGDRFIAVEEADLSPPDQRDRVTP